MLGLGIASISHRYIHIRNFFTYDVCKLFKVHAHLRVLGVLRFAYNSRYLHTHIYVYISYSLHSLKGIFIWGSTKV